MVNIAVLNVEGMSCSHCEAHIKEAVSQIDGVVDCIADAKKGIVEVTYNGDIDKIKATIEEEGYKVV